MSFHRLQVTLASGKEIETTVGPGGLIGALKQEIGEKLDQHPRPKGEVLKTLADQGIATWIMILLRLAICQHDTMV